MSVPEGVQAASSSKPYPHITLAVASGSKPMDSNFLPRRLAAREPGVVRVVLDEPLQVAGQILGFTTG